VRPDTPICVYTALFGRYELLNPQPAAQGGHDRWICFTDDPELESDDWHVVVVEPEFILDPHRSSRHAKMLGHPLVREFEASLWIDNSVVLDDDPRAMVSEWLRDNNIAFASHSYRLTLLDEFLVVLDDELDDPSRVIEQLEHYARVRPHVLEERPFWGGIIARRHCPEVALSMEVWWNHLLRYSRRDQLSLLYALDSTGLTPRRVDIDNFESRWHQWPVVPERNREMRSRPADAALRRPLAHAFKLERELERVRNELKIVHVDLHSAGEVAAESERSRAESESRLSHMIEVDQPRLAAEFASTQQELAEVNERVEQGIIDRVRVEQANTKLQEVHEELGRQLVSARDELNAIRSSRTWQMGRVVSRSAHAIINPIRRRATGDHAS